MRIENKNNKRIAVLEIILLVVSLFAFMWMIGGDVKVVSAAGGGDENCVAQGGSCTELLSSHEGDSCTIGGKAGTVKENLCQGDFISKRCCVPNLVNPEDVPQEEDKPLQDTAQGLGNAVALAGGANDLWKGFKNVATKVTGKGAGATSTESALNSGGGVVKKTYEGTGIESLAGQGGAYTLKEFLFGAQTAEGGWTGVGGSSTLGAIGSIVVWAGAAFIIGRYVIGPLLLGLNVQQSQGLGYSLAAGVGAGLLATSETIIGASAVGGPVGIVIGVIVAFVVSIFAVKNASADVIVYSCYSWDSQLGGNDCELCNNQEIPCTEYQCKSLGQGCELTIDEDTGQALCQWENPNDILAPVIKAWDKALLDKEQYRYTPYTAVSPPDEGVQVVYANSQDGCAPAWTPVSFGITLDERARCKFSPGIIFDDYASMPDLFLDGSARLYNHSYQLSLPSKEALAAENVTLENGNDYEFYLRCQDSNGNANLGNFVVKFCIEDGPDTHVPVIIRTSPLNNTPFQTGQQAFNVSVFVNKPSECKWSSQDKSYELMENNMSCATSVSQANFQNQFECKTELTGLRNNANNDFYFRCKDQPYLEGTENAAQRNTNLESYHYRLVGTEELIISEVGPQGTISDSTSPVAITLTAETALGYDNGKSICSLSRTGEEGSFIEFYYGYGTERYSQYQHSQEINLGEGNYAYEIRCCDKANNCDQKTAEFNVEIDSGAPTVVRAFKEDNYLKIITDEKGECVYSTFSCAYNFDEDGTSMITYSGGVDSEHYTEWNIDQDYYIKCQDEFGNRPASNQCSLIARPFEIPELRS